MNNVAIRLPWPPSINNYWRNTPKGTLLSRGGRRFRAESEADIERQLGLDRKIAGRVSVALELTPPTRQQWDADNHIKAALDALVHAGVLEDDSAQYIKSVSAEWTDDVESPGCCDVYIHRVDG